MRLKNWIPLVAAVLLGLVALVVARKALTRDAGPDAEAAAVAVVVAKRDVPPGRELAADDLAVSRLPSESTPQQSFRTPQDLVGRITVQPLTKGQALVEPLLAPTGTRGGLNGLIPAGQRAMTVEVNEFTGMAGMIQPGSRVDVIAILRDDKTQQPTARTVMQNIEVRAVGRSLNPPPAVENGPPTPPSNNVTLLVTPKQAQALQLASQNGRPWLVMRNGRDGKDVDAAATTLADLRDDKPTALAKVEPVIAPADPTTRPAAADPFVGRAPAVRVVQVIRGGVESTVTFPTPLATGPEPTPAATPTVATPATRPAVPPATTGDDLITGADPRPAN